MRGLLTILAAGALLAACGDDEPAASADPASAQLFVTAGCGACHVLEDAGTQGTTGPDLDDLAPDATRVKTAMETGPGLMPGFTARLSPAQIDQLAAYVESVTGD